MNEEGLSKLEKLCDRWANEPLSARQENSMLTDAMEAIPDMLEHIKAVSGERDSALKERDELSEGMARELAENLELFNKVGLNTKEDFGNDTSTAALSKKITAIINERDAALKCVAEMRRALEHVRNPYLGDPETHPELATIIAWEKTKNELLNRALSSDCGKDFVPKAELDAANAACAEMRHVVELIKGSPNRALVIGSDWINHALSSDCGKGYHHDDEWKMVVEALDKLARLGNEPAFGNSIGNHIAQQALAHAERLMGKETK